MTHAVLAELNRFISRRAVAVLLLAAALFTGMVAAHQIWDTRAATAEEIATARAQSEVAADDADVQAELAACREDPPSFLGPEATAVDCRAALAPTDEDLLPRKRLSLGRVLNGLGPQVAVVVVAVTAIAATTFGGADWRTGAIGTQLMHQPRRTRVWVARALAVGLGTGVATAVILGAFWAALRLAAEARGLTVADATVTGAAWHLLRAVVLAMAAAVGSYALAMLLRGTVATLAVLFTYAVGAEVLVNLVPIDGAARWTAGANLYGWLKPDFRYIDPAVGCEPYSSCDAMRSLSALDAAWFLGALLVVVVVVSLLAFRRRDV